MQQFLRYWSFLGQLKRKLEGAGDRINSCSHLDFTSNRVKFVRLLIEYTSVLRKSVWLEQIIFPVWDNIFSKLKQSLNENSAPCDQAKREVFQSKIIWPKHKKELKNSIRRDRALKHQSFDATLTSLTYNMYDQANHVKSLLTNLHGRLLAPFLFALSYLAN